MSGRETMQSASPSGFTLIELLVAVGIIGLVSSIVIVAINPSQQLADAKDADRILSARAFEQAITQYTIDEWNTTALTDQSVSAVEGVANTIPICRYGAVDATCLSLDLLVPTYIADIPDDPDFIHETHSGYCTYLTSSRFRVVSVYLLPVGGACSGDELLIQEETSSSSSSEASASSSVSSSLISSSAPSSSAPSSVASSLISSSAPSVSSSQSSQAPVPEGGEPVGPPVAP